MSLTLRFSGNGRRTSSFLILVRLGGLWEEKKENIYSIYNLLWGKQLVREKAFCTMPRDKKREVQRAKKWAKKSAEIPFLETFSPPSSLTWRIHLSLFTLESPPPRPSKKVFKTQLIIPRGEKVVVEEVGDEVEKEIRDGGESSGE